MYNPLLDTFVAVAETGSFTKAAEKLFISPTAVMKKVNALEQHLNMKLTERTPSGIKLTPAGTSLLSDSRKIMEFSEKSVRRANEATRKYNTTFCVGTSLLNPAKPFTELWYKVNSNFPGYKLHLVPFEDNSDGILSEIEKLGEKFDFLMGVCDSKAWLSLCNFLPLGKYKKMIAVSREHPLSKMESIDVKDLHGYTLMMVKRGDSDTNDRLRDDLTKNHPEIKIEDTPRFYDLSVFNRCAESGNILLTTECWKDVHPGLVSIPVNWNYSITYGILYSSNPPEDVSRFIDIVKKEAV